MTNFDTIETPALLIEKSILENNIKSMQERADKNNLRLRPHIKTHKSPYIAQMQLDAGACGIACAKPGEAEVMAGAGFRNIQIANIIVMRSKVERILKLHKTGVNISCCVDSKYGVDVISAVFTDNSGELPVFIKINTGYNRAGLSEFEEIESLCEYIQNKNGIKTAGILSHDGRVYSAATVDEVESIAKNEAETMVNLMEKLRAKGFNIQEVSVGSTPGAVYLAEQKGITELRPGNYIYNDMIQVALGTTGIDNCALTVLANVVSTPAQDRVIIDAGSKALNLDKGAHSFPLLKGHGKIIGKKSVIERLSEEHGIINNHGEKFRIGSQIRIIPNHACTVSNLYDFAYLVDGNNIIERIEIEARGKNY